MFLFKNKKSPKKIKIIQKETVKIGTHRLQLHIKEHPRAKRCSLRIAYGAESIYLTVPPCTPLPSALHFFHQSKAWLLDKLPNPSQKISFEDGAIFPLLGKKIKIHHQNAPITQLYLEKDTLHVSCKKATLERHIINWLKQEIYHFLDENSNLYAQKLGVKINKITLKDTRSRWGSCSLQANINYSWRLIFTPIEVARYVVIHEVCHLVEMNHGPAFWRLVESLCPDYKKLRKWLKEEGKYLL